MLGCGPLLLGVAKVRVNQYAHDTLYDRYPAIYQQVSRLALETFGNAPKVMSFGSSTGLEALTLAQKYFEKKRDCRSRCRRGHPVTSQEHMRQCLKPRLHVQR